MPERFSDRTEEGRPDCALHSLEAQFLEADLQRLVDGQGIDIRLDDPRRQTDSRVDVHRDESTGERDFTAELRQEGVSNDHPGEESPGSGNLAP